jgi:hypothetical protein
MADSLRTPSTFLAVGVVVAAIFGYILGSDAKVSAGNGHASTSTVTVTHPLFAGNLILEAPEGWQNATGSPGIPGLAIAHAVSIAPTGSAAQTGLLTGQLPGGEPSPLPAAFLSRLSATPRGEVVNLPQSEAFRYSNVTVPGFRGSLTLYVIPSPGGDPTALACYAPQANAAVLRSCEQIATTLRLVAQGATSDLVPNTGYASSVSATVAGVDRERTALRRQMQTGATLASVQHLATRLGRAFSNTKSGLAQLEPPLVAGRAQSALIVALAQAGKAYGALAAAAGAGQQGSYEAARTQVTEAESQVDAALANFALLGYARP